MTSLIKTGEIIKIGAEDVLITSISNKDYDGDRIYFYLKNDGEIGKIVEKDLKDIGFTSISYSKEDFKKFMEKSLRNLYDLEKIQMVEVSMIPWEHKQLLLGKEKDCYLSSLGFSQKKKDMLLNKSKFEIVDKFISLDEFLKDFRPYVNMI